MASLGPSLPVIAEQTNSTLSTIGLLFTTRSIGFLGGAVSGGSLFDKYAGNRVVAALIGIMALTFTLIPLQANVGMLTIIFTILGFTQGALDVGGNTLLVWTHGVKVAPFINGLHAFFGIGAFVSPFVITTIEMIYGNIHWAYWIVSLIFAAAFVWFGFFLPSPTPQAVNSVSEPPRVNKPVILLVAVFLFFYMGLEASFGGWIFTYALNNQLTKASAALLTSFFWLALIVGRLIYIPLTVKVKPYLIILVNLGGVILSLSTIIMGNIWPAAIWIGTVAFGFFLSPVFPTTFAFAKSRFAITGKTTAWFFTGSSLGSMVIPWIIGQLLERYSPVIMMELLLADISIGMLIFLVLLKKLSPNCKGSLPNVPVSG